MDLKAQRDRFMAFSFASADLLLETDDDGRVTFALGAAKPLGHADADALVGTMLVDLFDAPDRPLMEHVVSTVRPGRRFGPVVVRAPGAKTPAQLFGCALPGAGLHGYFTVNFDANGAPPAAEAERDAATGLVSAQDFETVASDTLDQLQASGRDVAMTMVSIPDQAGFLKKLGDDEGDAFLTRVGAILRAASVGDAAAQVAEGRYSLIHDSHVDATAVTRDLADASKDADPDGEGVSVEGHSVAVDDAMSAQDTARALVYTVNAFAEDGAGGLDFASMGEALEDMVANTGQRIAAFKKSIADKRVGFVAQPIVELASGRISHYELLVRFEQGKSPFEMVSFAEKTGIITDLDMAVLEVAGMFLQRADRDFPGLAVNISGLSIVNESFATRLYAHLQRFSFAAEKLTFEITESSEISDLAAADANIQKIRKYGHKVCLDDFGAGSASFQYLRRLDIDGVKIDGMYVREALSKHRDALLLKAMAGLCRDLGMFTVAEMVETPEHVTHLKKLGVVKGQGYHFGRPEPLNALGAGAKAA